MRRWLCLLLFSCCVNLVMTANLFRPYRLLHRDHASGALVLDEEGLRVLEERFCGPTALVPVVGRARSGKSYSLNTLLQQPQVMGFPVSDADVPETQGAYVWPEPLGGRTSPWSVVLVDTEGLGVGPASYDKALLLLLVMVSSRVLYHTTEMVYLDDVLRLHGMACLIDDYASRGLVEAGIVQLPALSWVVQKYHFFHTREPLDVVWTSWLAEHASTSATPSVASEDPSITHFNRTVRAVRALFPNQTAHLIPSAGPAGFSRPDKAYVAGMDALRAELLAAAVPRTIAQGGRMASGADIARLLRAVATVANDRIDVSGDGVVEAIIAERAATLAREVLAAADGLALPMELTEVRAALRARTDELSASLSRGVAGAAAAAVARGRATVEAALAAAIERAEAMDRDASARLCARVAREALDGVARRVAEEERLGLSVRAPQYAAFAELATAEYDAHAVGPAKEETRSVMLTAALDARLAVLRETDVPRRRFAWFVCAAVTALVTHVAGEHLLPWIDIGCIVAFPLAILTTVKLAALAVMLIVADTASIGLLPFTFEQSLGWGWNMVSPFTHRHHAAVSTAYPIVASLAVATVVALLLLGCCPKRHHNQSRGAKEE